MKTMTQAFFLLLALMFATPASLANGTDTGPGTPISTFPFADSGFLNGTRFSNTIGNYPYPCDIEGNYAGADVVYQFNGATDSTYHFTLTSDNPGNTDFVMTIVSDFNDGSTCIANSEDAVDDIVPEVISGFTPSTNGTIYLVVDAYSDASGYPKYGSWSLDVACFGSCPAVSSPDSIFENGFEMPP